MMMKELLEVLDKSEYIYVYDWKETVYEGYVEDVPFGLLSFMVGTVETAKRNFNDTFLRIFVLRGILN